MKLKKATNIKINYPSRETISPILAGIGVALTLSACSQTVGQEPIVTQESKNHIEESENIAGGMPVHIPPPPKEQNVSKFKTDIYQVEKEIIVPPRVTAGVPALKSK